MIHKEFQNLRSSVHVDEFCFSLISVGKILFLYPRKLVQKFPIYLQQSVLFKSTTYFEQPRKTVGRQTPWTDSLLKNWLKVIFTLVTFNIKIMYLYLPRLMKMNTAWLGKLIQWITIIFISPTWHVFWLSILRIKFQLHLVFNLIQKYLLNI